MTGIVILAAGESSRLGRPKQNLLYKGKSLLHWSIQSAVETGCQPIVVVTGANNLAVEAAMEQNNVEVVYNINWQQGMGSSIAAGTSAILYLQPLLTSVIFQLCDQPFVSAELLKALIQQHSATTKNIIAASYNHTLGAPVLFHKKYFQTLLQSTGHEGARKLIIKHPEDVAAVDFAGGAFDVDTEKDYEALLQTLKP